jgi:hypothetical protein
MTNLIGSEARKANPTLEPFEPLIGEWRTSGTHPLVPGKTFHGRASFSWIEGGAFLIWRSEMDEPEIPSGTAILGSDDAEGTFSVLYLDERLVGWEAHQVRMINETDVEVRLARRHTVA